MNTKTKKRFTVPMLIGIILIILGILFTSVGFTYTPNTGMRCLNSKSLFSQSPLSISRRAKSYFSGLSGSVSITMPWLESFLPPDLNNEDISLELSETINMLRMVHFKSDIPERYKYWAFTLTVIKIYLI